MLIIFSNRKISIRMEKRLKYVRVSSRLASYPNQNRLLNSFNLIVYKLITFTFLSLSVPRKGPTTFTARAAYCHQRPIRPDRQTGQTNQKRCLEQRSISHDLPRWRAPEFRSMHRMSSVDYAQIVLRNRWPSATSMLPPTQWIDADTWSGKKDEEIEYAEAEQSTAIEFAVFINGNNYGGARFQ